MRASRRSKRREEEENIPVALAELFPEKVTADRLAMITETPPHFIMKMVYLELVNATLDPKRRKPLTQIFREAFDRRMISKGREGRREYIKIWSQHVEQESVDSMEFG
tara:strand:+ start:302 stop:625 length:324 start_codon:yes stop_codon:yes gene_type:complete